MSANQLKAMGSQLVGPSPMKIPAHQLQLGGLRNRAQDGLWRIFSDNISLHAFSSSTWNKRAGVTLCIMLNSSLASLPAYLALRVTHWQFHNAINRTTCH
jgi:hypothetical protein